MKKSISRRDFLKGAAAGSMAFAASGILGFNNSSRVKASEAVYTAGTYSASATGAMGDVTVTMTFSETAITDVVLDLSKETPDIGQAAGETLMQAILDSQSSEIDTVSGASMTSGAVQKAAAKCIKQAKGEIPVEVVTENTEAAAEDTSKGWLGEAPEVTEIKETWETDILIVGAGNAGMAAAAYAADKGLNFRVVEQNPMVCDTRNWYGAADTSDALAADRKIDRQRAMTELSRYASGKNDQRVVKVWLDESAAMHEFVKGIMNEYGYDCYFEADQGVAEDGTNYYHAPIQHNYNAREDCEYADKQRNEIFLDYIQKKGYDVDFEHSLVELVKDGDKVIGAIVKNSDDEYIQINAANGVLLTTGGYEGNPEMMEALAPMAVSCITANSYFGTNKGQGIKAALWAGADMDKEPAPYLFDRGAVAPGVDAGYQVAEDGSKSFPGTISQWNPGTQPFMKVNRDGVRFANEGCPYNDIVFAASNQKGGVYCQVYDANFKEDWQKFHLLGCASLTRVLPDMMAERMEENVEAGIIMKADTLDELADKLGFEGESKEAFLAQCDRYNTIYDNGEDDEFFKSQHLLSELRTAPFYGVWLGASLLATGDGVKITPKTEVLDKDKNVIEGLYAAGNASGNFFANNYPELFPGLACGRAMTLALKAVKVMSGEEA
ncbi:MAG: FAD-binding protein [Eubacteriales bacterium]|nr:FAD-binding protein [Eubacteriales bacterium]